ncbi:MAG: hypothetical protein KDA52_16265 [Planctomycetaceae bacterium]|nr:hypothetical protein [Planctomycetaceae bacterium]
MNRVLTHLRSCDCQKRRRRQAAFDQAAATIQTIVGDVIEIESRSLCDDADPRLTFYARLDLEPTKNPDAALRHLHCELTREHRRLQIAIDRLSAAIEGGVQ